MVNKSLRVKRGTHRQPLVNTGGVANARRRQTVINIRISKVAGAQFRNIKSFRPQIVSKFFVSESRDAPTATRKYRRQEHLRP